jgi:hypothetical protein
LLTQLLALNQQVTATIEKGVRQGLVFSVAAFSSRKTSSAAAFTKVADTRLQKPALEDR